MNDAQPRPHWPSGDGRTVCLLDVSRDQLEHEGLEFREGRDSLDTFIAGSVTDEHVGEIWLLQRSHAPLPGFELLVDAAIGRTAALKAMQRQLGLTDADCSWINPDEHDEIPRPHTATYTGH